MSFILTDYCWILLGCNTSTTPTIFVSSLFQYGWTVSTSKSQTTSDNLEIEATFLKGTKIWYFNWRLTITIFTSQFCLVANWSYLENIYNFCSIWIPRVSSNSNDEIIFFFIFNFIWGSEIKEATLLHCFLWKKKWYETSVVVYLCINFVSMQSIFALPGWRHECSVKKMRVIR